MLPQGTQAGAYRIERKADTGGTSDVYEGRDASGGPVAIKVLATRWCVHAEMVARFLQEAQSLLSLRHPHLVQGLAVGLIEEKHPYLVLEWLPRSLEQGLAAEGGQFKDDDCARIVHQLAGALSLLHENGWVHRDLKPANVLLACEGPGRVDVRLSDLGLAKRLSGPEAPDSGLPLSTAEESFLGSRHYMAPEQWVSAKRVGPAVDVYALGVLWFQMLAGRLPFPSEAEHELMFQHVTARPPTELLEAVASGTTVEMVARMLDKVAGRRPPLSDVLALTSGTR
ncbi:Serine/threonine protein kinase [Myxococcus hansupus]|uniref:Serine/threonine protein kinase n=1 Tax=Pseudomyxococcus hansupus TaxID=1297742 RepID=A0A0H4X8L5_9BACT|nr:serine/threonine-protein kinase [Myxococcus hansupus]AKQ70333.1 Serine/threonine protein kinase [Myxococcus hansupus]